MIRRRTVFVLGAGASIPYGFPGGEQLLRDVRRMSLENLRNKIRDSNAGAGVESGLLYTALQGTHDGSLDELLELRPDITRAGKRLIASILLELEFHSPGRFPEPKDDWLTLFFVELARETRALEDFERNPLTIVTYNYDRLVEHRLIGALMSHYGRSRDDCIAALGRIPIIHLHGDLGLLPGFPGEGHVQFGPDVRIPEPWPQYVDIAAKRIVIVHEVADTPDFARARLALAEAEQIVLLGFGYGEKNVERLRVPDWGARGAGGAPSIVGTRYGLSGSRCHHLIDLPFSRAKRAISGVSPQWGSRQLLDENLDIFRV